MVAIVLDAILGNASFLELEEVARWRHRCTDKHPLRGVHLRPYTEIVIARDNVTHVI